MKLFLVVIFGAIGFSGCMTGGETELIPTEKMKYILRDLLIADGVTSVTGKDLIHKDVIRRDIQNEVLEAHGVTPDLFFRSYAYYVNNPPQLDSMFRWIVYNLQALQNKEMERQRHLENEPLPPVISDTARRRIPVLSAPSL